MEKQATKRCIYWELKRRRKGRPAKLYPELSYQELKDKLYDRKMRPFNWLDEVMDK